MDSRGFYPSAGGLRRLLAPLPVVLPCTALLSLNLLLLSFAVLPPSLSGQDTPSRERFQEQPDPLEDLRGLAEASGVGIAWKTGAREVEYGWGRRSWREAAEWEIRAHAPILLEELGLYPEGFFRRAQVREIILCRDLWIEQEGVEQHVSGHLEPGTGTFWVNVAYTYKVNNRPKQRRVIHHALFHHLDYVMNTSGEDPVWQALNPDGFEYGSFGAGGIHDRTSASGLLTEEYPGFLNRYSTGHIADDKADIFAYLMVLHHYVAGRAREDPVIAAKVEEMKGRLRAFDPRMDAAFWERIDGIRRDLTPYITP